jgi:aquaporin Z
MRKGLGTIFLSEFVGTALLVLVGLSFVILDFGAGGPVSRLIPGAGWRRAVTGFLFGSTGCLITLSPVGKHSGAHINPVVSLAFRLRKKLDSRQALVYIAAQLAGATAGCVPLLLWGGLGRSVQYGASLPSPGFGNAIALAGEAGATFCLIVLLFFFLGRVRLRRFTPFLFPFLYGLLVFCEAPLSGTSTNPARSLGPEVVSWVWRSWWVYWLGPLLGMALGLALHRLPGLRRFEEEVAKLYHFEHDPFGIFHRGAPQASRREGSLAGLRGGRKGEAPKANEERVLGRHSIRRIDSPSPDGGR